MPGPVLAVVSQFLSAAKAGFAAIIALGLIDATVAFAYFALLAALAARAVPCCAGPERARPWIRSVLPS